MSSISLELSEAINYEVKQSSHPSYRKSRVLPQGNSEVTLLSGSTSQSTFQVPNVVYNLKRSTLEFRQEIAEPALGNSLNSYCMGPPIDSVVLASRENTEIFRVDNCDIYCATVLPYLVKRSDFMTFPNSRGLSTPSVGVGVLQARKLTQKGFNFFPNDTVLSDGNIESGCSRNGYRIGSGIYEVNERAYSEMQYFRLATFNEAIVVNHSFPLWTIAPHTLASMDKDMYFSQNLQLSINWSPTHNMGFESTSVLTIENPVGYTGLCQMKEIRLQLAVETNQRLAELVKERVMTQGMKLFVPFVRSYGDHVGMPTEGPSMTQRLSLSNGQRLLCVYNILMNHSSTLNYRHDKSNNGQGKVLSYQNQINSLNLSENRINEENANGWTQTHRELCEGSCITDQNVYEANRVNILSFRAGKTVDYLDSDGTIDGIDLSEEQTITIDQTTPSASCRQYMFVITSKMLSIDPSGAISMQ